MYGRGFTLFIVAAVLGSCLLLAPDLVHGSNEDEPICDARLSRAREDAVLSNFQFWRSKFFFGQDLAVDATEQLLRRLDRHDLLILHFVGASGTGKTYLTYLIQRSFFERQQCARNQRFEKATTFSAFASKLPCPLSKSETIDLPNLHDACGIGYGDFLSAEKSADGTEKILISALDAGLASRNGNEFAVIVFDNFNKCKDECEKLLSKYATTKKYYSVKHGKTFRLSKTIFLLTSDLSEEGLRLLPGDSKRKAIERVTEAVRSVWGDDSMWNDLAYFVPFLPYSEQELVKITELTISEVEHEVKKRIEQELEWRLKDSSATLGSRMEWVGRFKFSEQDKIRLLDNLNQQVLNQNARAFERIKGWFMAASKRPELVELRLVNEHKPIVTERRVMAPIKFIAGFFQGPMKVYAYTQNIVFKVVDDERHVIIEVEENDWEPGLGHESEEDVRTEL